MSFALLDRTSLAGERPTPRAGESLEGYAAPGMVGTSLVDLPSRRSFNRVTTFGAITDFPELTRVSRRTLTPIGKEITEPEAGGFVHEADETLDEITAARDRRLELLVRQFENASTPEEDARFHILTQRLRRLVPSVSPKEWDALNRATSDLEEISSDLDLLRAQFELR